MLNRIEASVRERTHRLVASMLANNPNEEADLISELAVPLPLQVSYDMMGIPEADHKRIFHWKNVIWSAATPTFRSISRNSLTLRWTLAPTRARWSKITASIITTVLRPPWGVDGEQLSSSEIASFFVPLVIAGNETTRMRSTSGR